MLSLLGRGGMGEVYRARDTKLKREVAIKVLPDAFIRDAERVARFQLEAEVLALLDHPHIAAIDDLADLADSRFLVLELVPGETLADRIARGPIPADDALVIARQIVEALEAAHEKGITHRDLKPANIKGEPDGSVKVLDFGLAKMRELVDLIRGIPSRFTFNTSIEDYPVWSPDGARVLFNFNPSGPADIYWKAASGAGSEELVLKSGTTKNPWDWSRDGRFILYEDDVSRDGQRFLMSVPVENTVSPPITVITNWPAGSERKR